MTAKAPRKATTAAVRSVERIARRNDKLEADNARLTRERDALITERDALARELSTLKRAVACTAAASGLALLVGYLRPFSIEAKEQRCSPPRSSSLVDIGASFSHVARASAPAAASSSPTRP